MIPRGQTRYDDCGAVARLYMPVAATLTIEAPTARRSTCTAECDCAAASPPAR
jgi:hypothetical protein